MKRERIFELVNLERARQESVHPNQDIDDFMLMGCQILGEEVGEVNKAWLEEDLENLREELVQVASVAVRWLELIEEEQG